MLDVFRTHIDSFVSRTLDDYVPSKGKNKIIHDPIWGSVVYYPWEIQLIDSPVVQRLRNIHQLGMAELTYTAARHSRFEHSLGTAAIAGRMMTRLQEVSGTEIVPDEYVYMVRLAGILHDVGHCFYSHLSESVYGKMHEFMEMKNQLFGTDFSAAPHEIYSYLIVTSDSFIDFFYNCIDYPDKGDREDCRNLLIRVANIIVGIVNEDGAGNKLSYMTSVINGEFDADKLDYTQRDSYSAGIAMTYGVERFLLKLIIYTEKESDGTNNYRIAVGDSALTTVEELIFNRNILFVYVYRHQKVLTTEALLKDIIVGMVMSGKLDNPWDFLDYSDDDIMDEDDDNYPFSEGGDISIGDIVRRIKKRDLPKRGAVYSVSSFGSAEAKRTAASDFLQSLDSSNDRESDLIAFTQSFSQIECNVIRKACRSAESARKEIYDLLCDEYKNEGISVVDFSLMDIYVSFPYPTKSKTSFLLVNRDGSCSSTEDIDYLRQWSESFNSEKWRGYVFCSSNIRTDLLRRASDRYFGVTINSHD